MLTSLSKPLALALVCAATSAAAAQLELRFDVQMNWRYDLSTNQFDSSFARPRIEVVAILDDTKIQVTPPGASTFIRFGPASIDSPLSGLVAMGFELQSLGNQVGYTSVQDTFITEQNQSTWTLVSTSQSNAAGSIGRWLQFTDDPRLADPMSFDSAELRNLLESHVGKLYSYREDSSFSGGGFQHNGTAQLLSVSPVLAVPEPSAVALLALGLAAIALRRRSIDA